MHPRWRRCSSLKYSRYSRSSRLAGGAPRRSRCDAGVSPRAATALRRSKSSHRQLPRVEIGRDRRRADPPGPPGPRSRQVARDRQHCAAGPPRPSPDARERRAAAASAPHTRAWISGAALPYTWTCQSSDVSGVKLSTSMPIHAGSPTANGRRREPFPRGPRSSCCHGSSPPSARPSET